jgi:predicted RND superfamily exporter protein
VFFTLQSGNTGSQDMNAMIAGMADGQPDWLGAIIKHSASLVAHHGLAASIVLAAVLTLVALAVFLPPAVWRAFIVLALVVAAVIWVVGEAVGGVFGGQGTDPNSGPLLALIALAYWPAAHPTSEPKETAQQATGDLERTAS